VNIGVFGVDPGGHTGCAWGIFNPLVDVGEQLRTRLLSGQVTVEGDARHQIAEVAQLWGSFYNTSVKSACLPVDRIWLVVENFMYSPGVNYEGETGYISTAIIWGLEGYRMGRQFEWHRHKRGKSHIPSMILQPAGDAKNYASAKRFREWGVWERGFAGGKEHQFSAWQHIAYFLYRYRSQVGK
jgi:hypothetical protein